MILTEDGALSTLTLADLLRPDGRRSMAERMAMLPAAQRDAVLMELDEDDARKLLLSWEFWGRPNQQEPTLDYFCWLLLAGRGFGKTRTGAEWINRKVRRAKAEGVPRRLALVAETVADARDVLIMGESGILACSDPAFMPIYLPTKRRLTWPDGTMAFTFSGDEPDQLRGPQFHDAWIDELAKYRYPQDVLDNLEFGLRLGDRPQMCITTTPRPIPVIKQLVNDPHTVITSGSTYENIANLAPSFITRTVSRYEGTRVGRQELFAEILTDTPGALWTYEMIDADRVNSTPRALTRIVVAIDPATSANEGSDETGIIVAGRTGGDRATSQFFILKDASGRYTPEQWARLSIQLFNDYKADRIIGERNQGGDMVETVLRSIQPNMPYTGVTATRHHGRRAEPVAALYEQHRVHHVGAFSKLEDQMCALTPDEYLGGGSPDRADALVWALTDLSNVILRQPLPPSVSLRTFR